MYVCAQIYIYMFVRVCLCMHQRLDIFSSVPDNVFVFLYVPGCVIEQTERKRYSTDKHVGVFFPTLIYFMKHETEKNNRACTSQYDNYNDVMYTRTGVMNAVSLGAGRWALGAGRCTCGVMSSEHVWLHPCSLSRPARLLTDQLVFLTCVRACMHARGRLRGLMTPCRTRCHCPKK